MSEINAAIPHKLVGVGIVWNEQGQILIDRRSHSGPLGGFWEFPGGKIEPGETVAECIEREIREELGIVVAVGKHLISLEHTYTHLHVTLNVYLCRYLSGHPMPLECDEVRWVTLTEIDQYHFPEANQQIIAILRQHYPG